MLTLSVRTLTKALAVHRVTLYKWMRPTDADKRPRTNLERMVDVWRELLPGIPNPILALGFAQVASGVVLVTAEIHERLQASGHIQRLIDHFPGLEIYVYPRPESAFEPEERKSDGEVPE